MNRENYYEKTKDYYKRVGNLWGLYTAKDYAIESFQYNGDHEEEIAKRAGITDNHLVVLDLGCGFGKTMRILEDKFPSNQYVGFTLCEEHLKRRQHENVMLGNFETIDFYNEVIDVIYFIESFNHAYRKQRVLNEAFRVLRPGGRLFILDQCVSDDTYRQLLHDPELRKQYRFHRDFYGAKPVSPDYIIRKAEKAGFRLQQCTRDAKNYLIRVESLASLKPKIIVEHINTVYSDFVFVK